MNLKSISLIFILLAQNLIKDKSWHVDDQKYNIKNYIRYKEDVASSIKLVPKQDCFTKYIQSGDLKQVPENNFLKNIYAACVEQFCLKHEN